MALTLDNNVPELLSPKVDVIFKMLFGDERNKELTIKFISAVLGYKDGEIEDIVFPNPQLKSEFVGDKLEILDVRAKLSNGTEVNIEMQADSYQDIRKRITYYKSDMITDQIGEGNSYSLLRPVKSIVVTGFDSVPESKKCHTVFRMLETEEHFSFNDLEEIHILNLKKLPQLKNEGLLNWLEFINSKDKEEFMQVAQRDPTFERALQALTVISADKEARMLYKARLKAWRDEQAKLEDAVTRGETKVINLMEQGYNVEQIKAILRNG